MTIRNYLLVISLFATSAVVVVGCNHQDDYYLGGKNAPKIESIFRFEKISTTSLPADSFSLSTIKVFVNNYNTDTTANVKFETSMGRFTNGTDEITVTANSSGIASASLLSAKPGIASVNVSSFNISIDTVINFTAAYPNDLILKASKYVADTVDTITVTCLASRDSGRVSDHVKISFTITPSSGSRRLETIPFAYTKNQEVQIQVTNPLYLKGDFLIEASATTKTNNSVSRTVWITIK